MDQPVIFGEVLFDCFPAGESVLGGAPFNVAWHLQGFGLQPHFISRIGMDALGDQVLQEMQAWGMSVSGIQRDAQLPTGRVVVALQDGQPSYEILPEQAYDAIEARAALASITSTPALLYHGSLALRSAPSRHALADLWNQLKPPKFVDINLRTPWFNADILGEAINNARWLKLNEEELQLVQSLVGQDCPSTNEPQALSETAQQFQQACGLAWLILTLGDKGAYVVSDEGISYQAPGPVEQLVDTVGAGDAFSAVTLFGILQQWPVSTIQERAIGFASAICSQRGATQNNPDLYQHFVKQWRL